MMAKTELVVSFDSNTSEIQGLCGFTLSVTLNHGFTLHGTDDVAKIFRVLWNRHARGDGDRVSYFSTSKSGRWPGAVFEQDCRREACSP